MDHVTALRAFVRVVELGSLTAAARELGVGQSTVSKWLAVLERHYAARLLDRTTRACRPTPAGMLLVERARDALAMLDSAAAEIADPGRPLTGRIRVSAPVVFGQRHLVPALAPFLARHPGVALDLVLDDRYVRLVEEGFDLAVRVGVPVDTSERAVTLARPGRVLVAAPALLLQHGTPADPEDLGQLPAVTQGGVGLGPVWTLTRGDDVRRVRVSGRVTTNNSEALRQLAIAGLGAAMLASWLVGEDLAAGRLVPLLPGWSPPPAPVCAVLPPGRAVHPRVRALLEALCAVDAGFPG